MTSVGGVSRVGIMGVFVGVFDAVGVFDGVTGVFDGVTGVFDGVTGVFDGVIGVLVFVGGTGVSGFPGWGVKVGVADLVGTNLVGVEDLVNRNRGVLVKVVKLVVVE